MPERPVAWACLANGPVAGEDQVDAGCVIDGEILLDGQGQSVSFDIGRNPQEPS
jgi:hypothetical protein